MASSLYFIALAPDFGLSAGIKMIAKDFAARFESVKSWNNFPHITIIPPFWSKIENEEKLMAEFESLQLKTTVFPLKLDGFDSYDNKTNPVIFIKPEPKPELFHLAQEVKRRYTPDKMKFDPHLTVAFRDLSYENYEKAWKEYSKKEFSAEFLVESIGLYKHFDKKWHLVASNFLRKESL